MSKKHYFYVQFFKTNIPWLIFFFGIILSLLGAFIGKKYMLKHNRDKFKLESESYVKSIKHEIEYNLSVLSPLTAFFKNSDFVTRDEFSEFVKEAYSDGRYRIQALEWIPKVKAEEKEIFEKQVQAEGFTDFHIKEKFRDTFIKAKERDEFYPVLYIEPFVGNEKAFGFDLSSSPQRMKSLLRSLENRTIVATNAISLVQETEEQYGFLVFSPIYKGPTNSIEERRSNLTGFTLGVFKISDIIEDAKKKAGFPIDYNLVLYERLPSNKLKVIYQPDKRRVMSHKKTPLFSFSDSINVAGIYWHLEISPEYSLGRDYFHIFFAFAILGLGLILSGILFYYIRKRELYTISKELEIQDRIIYEENLKHAKEKAEEATLAKSLFLANMSHEIRTPMNAIIGYSEILLGSELSETQKKHCSIVQKSSKELLAIINDILDSSKLDSGKMELENIVFNLPDLVEDIALTFSVKAKLKKILLQFDYDYTMPQLFVGDRNRLRQIIVNLVDNAIKFTEKGSVNILVKPSNKKDYIDFFIKDTGIGISPEIRTTIFDPFIQADSTISRTHGGTGLGTTICKKLVDLMGGKISVESKVGIGSTFHFSLKLKESEKPISKEILSLPLEFYKMRSLRILLAEDVVENAELCTLRLEEWGHTIVVVSNGQEALDKLETDSFFDLILMDVHMPIMDGLEATKRIRDKESINGDHIPILLLTASVLMEEQKSYFKVGIDGIVTKPIDFNILFSEITRVLSFDKSENSDVIITESTIEILPSVPGINTEEGIQRWTNVLVYLKNLSSFLNNSGEEIKKIRTLIKQNKVNEANKVVHKLKGVCSNFALPRITLSLETLNSSLRSNEHSDYQSQLLELDKSFQEVKISIQKLQKQSIAEQDKIELSESDLKKITHLMAELIKSFNHSHIDDSLVNQFLELLHNSIDSVLIKEFEVALDKFDFAEILETIDLIAKTLNIKKELYNE